MVQFQELIQKDRDERKKKNFQGTFLDYLEIVKKDPSVTMLAHERMYKAIIDKGVEVINTAENPGVRRIYGNDVIKKYNFLKTDYS